jgi:hypothetical protein
MLDEDLKRVAEAARNAEADYSYGKARQSAHRDALIEFMVTFDPPTVLSLLSRLSEAEAETARLRKALTHYTCDCASLDECEFNSDGDDKNQELCCGWTAARALQAKEVQTQ